MVGLILFVIALSATIAWLWAGGIIYMAKHHKNYKGKDFLDWDLSEEEKNDII
jgi:hypothetical protein